MSASSIVAFDDVGVRIGETDVLKGVSLDIRRGEILALTGPSGAGKSTLLRVAGLSVAPSRGRVAHFGADQWSAGAEARAMARRRLGFVYQDFRLIDHLSVFDNIALALRARPDKPQDYAGDVRDLIRWIGLGEKENARARTLSGGEKQRAAIARAVVAKPEIILADEPTGSVDGDMAERLLRLLVELNRLGATLVIATHDDRVVDIMKARRINLTNGELTDHLD